MCHVLVIEDDWMIAEHVAGIASDAGATTVEIACTEEEAIAFALAHCPAVILSDVQLQEGTGPLACQEIRRQLGELPVIFITATPDACEPCDYAAAILQKPVSIGQLTSEFQKVAPLH